MDNTCYPSLLFGRRVNTKELKDALFDYQRYNDFDALLFNENGQLNKRMNLFPLDQHVYDKSVLNTIYRIDQTIDLIDKQRAVLFPLFDSKSPLTGKSLTLQLDVLLVPLLDVSNRVIEHYYHNDPTSTIKERRRLAAELNSIVQFLQSIYRDMHRYRELSLLKSNFEKEIESSRGYLALHDAITSQTRMELEIEEQDFHDVYLQDRLLRYRDKALDKGLHKLRAEREKQKRLIEKALAEFERQYSAEIRNRTNVIRTLNDYLGNTFLNEIHPGSRNEVFPSGRRNVQFSTYLNALLPLYTSLRKLTIENGIFDTLQGIAKRSFLINQHD